MKYHAYKIYIIFIRIGLGVFSLHALHFFKHTQYINVTLQKIIDCFWFIQPCMCYLILRSICTSFNLLLTFSSTLPPSLFHPGSRRGRFVYPAPILGCFHLQLQVREQGPPWHFCFPRLCKCECAGCTGGTSFPFRVPYAADALPILLLSRY